MSYDLRRISFFGIVFLVLLRISIGWQFLYEGLWKLQSQKTADPWTAKGYLMNAQGPFRSYFRGMVDDPDDLNWLDFDHVKSGWEIWKKKFAGHYELTEAQQKELDELMYGRETYEVPLKRLPIGKEDLSDTKAYGPTIPKIIGFRPGQEPDQPGTLYVIEGQVLKPEHIKRFHELVPAKGEEEVHAAIDALWNKYTSASRDYVQSLENYLVKDPAMSGEPNKDEDGNITEIPPGEIKTYKEWLADYEKALANADRSSVYDHLNSTWAKIQQKRADLVGPVKVMDAELKADAYKLLTPEQRQKPPLPPEPSRIASVDQRTIWMLIILGGLLIAGCFTRVAAFLGAGLVLMFYLAMPAFPGLPAAPGPEHSYIINKNLIEVIALLALTFLPTGSWFGVDGIFRRIFIGDRYDKAEKPTKPAAQKDAPKPLTVKM